MRLKIGNYLSGIWRITIHDIEGHNPKSLVMYSFEDSVKRIAYYDTLLDYIRIYNYKFASDIPISCEWD